MVSLENQFFVEKHRNEKYQWLTFVLCLLQMVVYGLLNHHIPHFIRRNKLRYPRLYRFMLWYLKGWNAMTTNVRFRYPFMKSYTYFTPAYGLLLLAFLAMMGRFSYIGTKDIDYQPQYYIISKRVGRIGIGLLPIVYLCVIKSDLVRYVTGMDHSQLAFFHKMAARFIIVFQILHTVLSWVYWIVILPVMLTIPPQIFGWIALGSMGLMAIGGIKFIRNFCFEAFLTLHRILGFIMLLFTYFHSKGNHAIIILSVHAVVLDRIIARIYVFMYKKKGPTKGMAEFRILDDTTYSMTLPTNQYDQRKWYHTIFPGLGCWRPGHHVYLTVSKISYFQQHPFTVANLGNHGKMYLLIKVKKGFTLKLYKKLQQIEQEEMENKTDDSEVEEKDYVSLKASFHGPYGLPLQPLEQFDTSLFIGAGSGGSFTFPVAIDLIETIVRIQETNSDVTVFKPTNVKIVWIAPKKENMIWYQEQFETLCTYAHQYQHIINITIDVYITRESDPTIDYTVTNDSISANSRDPLTEESEKRMSTGRPLKSSKITNSSDVNTITKSETSYSDYSEIINYHYGRPDVEQYVEDQVAEVKAAESNGYSSVGVITCGPSQMTEAVEYRCRRVRNYIGAPDLYVYGETF